MTKHVTKNRVRQFLGRHKVIRLSIVARALIVVGISYLAVIGTSQYAQAVASVCSNSTYSANEKTACNDGIRGADCNDYDTIFKGQSDVADIITACNAGKNSGESVATSPSPSLSSLFPSNTSSTTANDQQAYKTAALNACGQYAGSSDQQIACLYGAGLGDTTNGSAPKSASDCLTNSKLSSSTANQQACISGVNAGKSYITAQNNGTLNSNNPNTSLDKLDQANSLSSLIDTLHSGGTDSKTDVSGADDTNPGSYVNGAGKQQPIKVMPCKGGSSAASDTGDATHVVKSATNVNGFKEETSKVVSGSSSGGKNCPALIWFNGGGWHSDDGTAALIASGSEKKNGGDDSSKGKPAGGGANARGYTVIEVTYRLGSSGVNYMFEDVMRGVQHVINNAGLYNIDASKIVIGGDSAGGSLSMRAVASGKSGAKVGIGWSAPTNAYTGLFKSYKTFLIGMDHSTCIPTDLAGLDNTTSLLTGGSGDVAQYGQGLSSNDFSGLGISQGGSPLPTGGTSSIGDPISTITQVMSAAQYASDTSKNIETISKELEAAQGSSGSTSGSSTSTGTSIGNTGSTGSGSSATNTLTNLASSPLASGVFNLSSKKLVECIDNFNALSPALFASPETPPVFMAGFDTDDLIDPQQAHDMVDKVASLGVTSGGGASNPLIIPGDENADQGAFSATSNHLGYDPRFVCATLNFMDSIITPDKEQLDCKTGKTPSQEKADADAAAAAPASSNNNGGATTPKATEPCDANAVKNSSNVNDAVSRCHAYTVTGTDPGSTGPVNAAPPPVPEGCKQYTSASGLCSMYVQQGVPAPIAPPAPSLYTPANDPIHCVGGTPTGLIVGPNGGARC